MLSKKNSVVDVVIGLDQTNLQELGNSRLLMSISELVEIEYLKDIKTYNTKRMLALDWSPLTLVRQGELAGELIKLIKPSSWVWERGNISLQDPRTSVTGLQFLWWWHNHFNKFFDKKSIHSLSASWSSSYGLFKTGRVDATFTYLSSLLYEWELNPKKKFQVLSDPNGHPLQIEFVAVANNSKNKENAVKLVKLILSESGQKLLVEKNYMFPVLANTSKFERLNLLPVLKTLDYSSFKSFYQNKEKALESWKKSIKN